MSITVSRRREDVPVFQGEDLTTIRALAKALNEAAETVGPRRIAESPVAEAAAAHDAAVAEALPRAVIVTVQALGRKKYRSLMAACPPRADHEEDAQAGYDTSTFPDLLLEHFDSEDGERTVVAPDFASKKALVDWLDQQSDGTFSELFVAALRVNEGGNPDPKASLTSRLAQLSGATSTSPVRLG